MLSPIVSPPVTAASRDGPATLHPSPPPSREAWALRDRGPKATAPHPTLKQRLGVSNDSSHSEHDLLLTGGEKTVA